MILNYPPFKTELFQSIVLCVTLLRQFKCPGCLSHQIGLYKLRTRYGVPEVLFKPAYERVDGVKHLCAVLESLRHDGEVFVSRLGAGLVRQQEFTGVLLRYREVVRNPETNFNK